MNEQPQQDQPRPETDAERLARLDREAMRRGRWPRTRAENMRRYKQGEEDRLKVPSG